MDHCFHREPRSDLKTTSTPWAVGCARLTLLTVSVTSRTAENGLRTEDSLFSAMDLAPACDGNVPKDSVTAPVSRLNMADRGRCTTAPPDGNGLVRSPSGRPKCE